MRKQEKRNNKKYSSSHPLTHQTSRADQRSCITYNAQSPDAL